LLLTTVSGIGPKLALGVLSGLPLAELVRAIQSEDVEKLATIPGIGKKTAARIALELKEKVVKIHSGLPSATIEEPAVPAGPYDDALSALVNLGYRPQDVKDALKRISKTVESQAGLKELIREGLKELARG
jgi:holliday junction DNA helicase RuvA